jgi:hypothetical protein
MFGCFDDYEFNRELIDIPMGKVKFKLDLLPLNGLELKLELICLEENCNLNLTFKDYIT